MATCEHAGYPGEVAFAPGRAWPHRIDDLSGVHLCIAQHLIGIEGERT